MSAIEVNLLAVFIAAVVSMGVGFFWYSPMLFGKKWMKLMGYTAASMKSAQKQMGMMYGLSFVATLLTAYTLNDLSLTWVKAFPFDLDLIPQSVQMAIKVWLGFIAPVQLTDVIFGSKKWMLFAINTGYQLVSVVAMGLVMSLLVSQF